MSEKKKPGRKQLDITDAQVQKLASFGLTNKEIAEYFGCEDSSIGNKFRLTLIKGRTNLKLKLKKKQIAIALSGNVSMLIWLGKQYLGQSDKTETDSTLTVQESDALKNLAKAEISNNL